MNNMGIYMFKNKVNGKKYIGQSINLESRLSDHFSRYNQESSNAFNSLFYRAVRKYGIENFEVEILERGERFEREELNEKEIFYIAKHDSYLNGYNMNAGGNYTSGEKRFNEKEIFEIKEELKKQQSSITELAEKFKCSISLLSMINRGITWRQVGNYSYPISKKSQKLSGGDNPNSKITNQEALSLRLEFVNKTLDELHKENKDRIPLSSLKKLVYGVSFKNLPVYKKREKKWFLDGTCIDYPRLEE